MSIAVLAAEDLEPPIAGRATVRLNVAFHYAGFPDGFDDMPARTQCFRMEFDDRGLVEAPRWFTCKGGDPWAD